MRMELGRNFHIFGTILFISLSSCGFGGGGGGGSSTDPAQNILEENEPTLGSGEETEEPDEEISPAPVMAPPFDYGDSFNNQDGVGQFTLVPSSQDSQLNWEQFGNFELPEGLTAVYAGPLFTNGSLKPLSYGFTHVRPGLTLEERNNTPPSARAILWTSAAGPSGQPWNDIESPWNNNTAALEGKWLSYLKYYANLYSDSAGQDVPNVDLLVSDIESVRGSAANILELKGHPLVPAEISALSDELFIDQYKRDMGALHLTPHTFAKNKGFSGNLGSYSLAPVSRTWWGIDDYSWNEWTTNPLRLFFINMDYLGGSNWLENFGPFYDSQDMLFSSAYLFYDYPASKSANLSQWNSAGDYLAYALFQMEVNRAWSAKDQLVFLWLRYHDSAPVGIAREPIRAHMAHALGIFPFLSGIKGIWLWDHFGTGELQGTNLSVYEYFVYGLYRLAQHAEIFEGNTEVYAPYNPHHLMTTNKEVVRGVVNLDLERMLVAVHNPYADVDEDTTVTIQYEGVQLGQVTVHGLETALAEFDIYPEPACFGDENNDGNIDAGDFALILGNFSQSGAHLPGDLNEDGTVDATDQTLFGLLTWGPCP